MGSLGTSRQSASRSTARATEQIVGEEPQPDRLQTRPELQGLQQDQTGPQAEQTGSQQQQHSPTGPPVPQQDHAGTQPVERGQASNQLQQQAQEATQLQQQDQAGTQPEQPRPDHDRPANQEQQQSRQPLPSPGSTGRGPEIEGQGNAGEQVLDTNRNVPERNSNVDRQQQQPASTSHANSDGNPASLPSAPRGAPSQQSNLGQTTRRTENHFSTPPRRYATPDGSIRGSRTISMRSSFHTGLDVDPDPEPSVEPSVAQGNAQDPEMLDLGDYNEAQLRQVTMCHIAQVLHQPQ